MPGLDLSAYIRTVLSAILRPEVLEYPTLLELLISGEITYERVIEIESQTVISSFGPETQNYLNQLFMARTALSILNCVPLTSNLSSVFTNSVISLYERTDHLQLKSDLINFNINLQDGLSETKNPDEILEYINNLKLIRDTFEFDMAEGGLAWADIQLKQAILEGFHRREFENINRNLDFLYKITENREDILNISANLCINFLEYSSSPQTDAPPIIGKLMDLGISDPSIASILGQYEEKYGKESPSVSNAPDESLRAKPSSKKPNEINSRSQLNLDQRAIYVRTDSDPQVHVYKGRLKNHPEIEVIAKEYVTAHKQKLDLFMKNEADILRECSGKNSCYLRFYGTYFMEENNNLVFALVMEKCEKSLMEDILHRKKLKKSYTETELRNMICALLEGFIHLHLSKIFHRDIKPHNILVTENKVLKIADFNISEISNHSNITTAAKTDLRNIQGTEDYMAPEFRKQLILKKKDRRKSGHVKAHPIKLDIYSLGMTFLQMCTLKMIKDLNVEENQDTLQELINSIQYPWVRVLLERMLEFDPQLRPAKMTELIEYINNGATEGVYTTIQNL